MPGGRDNHLHRGEAEQLDENSRSWHSRPWEKWMKRHNRRPAARARRACADRSCNRRKSRSRVPGRRASPCSSPSGIRHAGGTCDGKRRRAPPKTLSLTDPACRGPTVGMGAWKITGTPWRTHILPRPSWSMGGDGQPPGIGDFPSPLPVRVR
jgi:hypothetical protein